MTFFFVTLQEVCLMFHYAVMLKLGAEPWGCSCLALAHGLQGIVTHVTDVKPLIKVATYLDEESGVEVYQEVTGMLLSSVTSDTGRSCIDTMLARSTTSWRAKKLANCTEIAHAYCSSEAAGVACNHMIDNIFVALFKQTISP